MTRDTRDLALAALAIATLAAAVSWWMLSASADEADEIARADRMLGKVCQQVDRDGVTFCVPVEGK